MPSSHGNSSEPGSSSGSPIAHAFIGRTHELAMLRAALDDVLKGRGRLAVLAGEPGIGKTRLAEEVATYAAASGAAVAWGRCWDGGGEPPFWPWIQLVRESLRGSSREVPVKLGLLDVVPGLSRSVPPAQMNADLGAVVPVVEALREPSQRFLLFDAVANFFKRIAVPAPLMLVLDDLHAADEDSLLLLRFLARDLKQTRILLVATYRDAEVRRSPERDSLLADIGREGITIPLRGFGAGEIAEFVEHNAFPPVDGSIVPWLHHISGGNPFFLDEIVRLLAATSDSVSANLDSLAIPDTIRAAVRRRTSALKEQTRTILNVSSLLGPEFELSLLQKVCGLPADQIIESLEEARAASLISEGAAGFGRYRFTHAITAEALRGEIGAAARAQLHHRIAAAIETVYRDDIDNHLAELAHHYIQAAPLGSAQKAVEFARRGAQRARSQLAFAEASRLYAMALHALAGSRRDELQRYDLLVAMGEAQAQGQSINEARQSFEQAVAIARALGRSDLLARAVVAASIWFDSYFKVDSGLISMLSEALVALGPSDTPVRVALMAKLAAEYYWSGERERGLNLCESAVAAARRIADPHALVAAVSVQNQIEWGPDNLEDRLTRASEIASLAESVGDYQHALRAHEMRFAALLEKGDLEGLESEVRAYRLLAEKSGEQFGIVERFRAALALLKGDFDEAERQTSELSRYAHRRQDPALLACARALKEVIATERAQIDPVEMERVRKEQIAQSPTMALGFRAGLALFYAVLGRQAEARAELDSLAKENFSLIPRDWNWLANMCTLALLCVALRDSPRATVVYDLLLPYGKRNVTVGWGDLTYGCASRFLGMLAAMLGKFDEAEVHFGQALQFDQYTGGRPWAAYAKFEYARMLIRRSGPGDLERAIKLVGESRDTATVLGMKVLELRAAALMTKATQLHDSISRQARSSASQSESPSHQRIIATIMFVDIVSSTKHLAELKDRRWVEVRASFFELLRQRLSDFDGREIQTAGDSMLALFSHPASAIRAAFAMAEGARSLGLAIRAGIHTGECELVGADVVGIAVHIGARVADCAAGNEVLVSSTVRDLMAGGDIVFADRGTQVLKGVPGQWHLYAVEGPPR